jgi:hypothetical protein
MAARSAHRTWTAVITVAGYSAMMAAWSEHDEHDDQLLHAAHEALRLMAASGAQVGGIDLFKNSEENGNVRYAFHTVSFDERGTVVSKGRQAR